MQVRHIFRGILDKTQDMFRFHQDVEQAINGGIEFGSPVTGKIIPGVNINGVWAIVADTGLANTEFSVIHNLNRIPVGFDVKRINLAAHIFDSGTVPTKTKMFFKCDVAHVVVTFFIH